jgi:hypothetical protein
LFALLLALISIIFACTLEGGDNGETWRYVKSLKSAELQLLFNTASIKGMLI